MAKTVGRACAQIAIILTIYGSIQCVKSISPDEYVTLGTNFHHINREDIVSLSSDQLSRQQRSLPANVAVRADFTSASGSTLDVNDQYQSVRANVSGSGAASVAATGDSKTAATGSIAYNVHNVGVNGTGQRKDYSSVQSNSSSETASNYSNPVTTINVATAPNGPPKKTQLMASQTSQYPKKTAAQSVQATITTTTTTERPLIDDVDVPDEVITKEAANAELTRHEDHYDYYNSVLYINKTETANIWAQFRNIPENAMLSSSHRRAMTVELKFRFPFYGHYVRNITVATGGFLYTGEYVHSWLAATQYIAPLMANFDTSISDDSFVRLQDNGTAFTVVWENVTLQDKPKYGKFTFSATLHENGNIVFVYYQLPTFINNIQDNQHPVKVGLSDAYIVDKELYFARRKTIYEYHRVTFSQPEITNSTIVVLTALPTCLGYTDCEACINHNTSFVCVWCPTLNRCSTNNGSDRRKQEWQQKGCDRSMITKTEACPALGQRGNNAAQENNNNSGDNSNSSNSSNNNNNNSNSNSNSSNTGNSGQASTTPAANAAGGSTPVTEPSISSTQQPTNGKSRTAGAASDNAEKSEHLGAELPENKNVGVAVGFMVPICLVFAVTLWLFYAYRNPHTRSGQLLIQFRPSQWSWRRGEARYTAATIHM